MPRRAVRRETGRARPLGPPDDALLAVYAPDADGLRGGLDRLAAFASAQGAAQPHVIARRWFVGQAPPTTADLALVVHARRPADLERALAEAADALRSGGTIRDRGGVFFSPKPLGGGRSPAARASPHPAAAIVFPGSGNHFPGMGLDLAAAFPDVVRGLDGESERLASHLLWDRYGPFRASWAGDWRGETMRAVEGDVLHGIVAQVMYGVLMHDVLRRLGLRPGALLGYSLGESTALVASRAWADRDELFERLETTTLFRTDLAPPYDAVRAAWGIAAGEAVEWRMLLVGRGPEAVRAALEGLPHAALLIVNTPGECVVGGLRAELERVVARLRCRAVELRGVASVHCEVVRPVLEAYRALHRLPTTAASGVRYYSAHARAGYDVTSESAADAIAAHALHGFDFAATVERAWADGVRVFIESGPQATCTRMIRKTLGDRPHLALSACDRLAPAMTTLMKTVAALLAERVIDDLSGLYGREDEDEDDDGAAPRESAPHGMVRVVVGGGWDVGDDEPVAPDAGAGRPSPDVNSARSAAPALGAAPLPAGEIDPGGELDAAAGLALVADAAADAHAAYLEFSRSAASSISAMIDIQRRLAALGGIAPDALESAEHDGAGPYQPNDVGVPAEPEAAAPDAPFLDRAACLEFARGRIGNVLGPAFASIDDHPTRVRLPDEPLMLVDRILSVEGEPGSLTAGRVVTEHDVGGDAWYLDCGRAPVCIAVEAGQADLFLCAWLGIDRVTGGRRMYRLLDAAVEFHRDLPAPGETIRYDIRIERFLRQGETWIFAFSFEGTIAGRPLLTMRGGRAGFFTLEEVHASRGIVLTDAQRGPQPDEPLRFAEAARFGAGDLAPVAGVESYDAAALEALRRGELRGCFGAAFADLALRDVVGLPGGRMRLIDRVVELDPTGGRYGRGLVRAEWDVHADDWFLTCHFVDDMTMPGTLMYECCMHALRVLLLRLGWVGARGAVAYQPIAGVESRLRCRGPVTPATRRVCYEVEVRELGYRDAGAGWEPYAIADALMYADGKRVVQFRDMSVRLAGVTRAGLEELWRRAARTDRAPAAVRRTARAERTVGAPRDASRIGDAPISRAPAPAVFDHDRILAFAVGDPSYAFGERYRIFDRERRIARLPGPPFQFLDRVTRVSARAWELEPGGWIETQYDVPRDAWYFAADRQRRVPYSVILEAALQPCGWLAAYLGSALRSESFLAFRNLGGTATLYEELLPDAGTLTGRSRITEVSQAGGMIVEKFDTQLWRAGRLVYDCKTVFGFFSEDALSRQVGIRDAGARRHVPGADESARARRIALSDDPPFTPAAASADFEPAASPARAYRMIDCVDAYIADGGPCGQGFLRGSTSVDPGAWFFQAHFHQDPVWPGSLGLESLLQLLRIAARERWPERAGPGVHFTPMRIGHPHEWVYRGQITPRHRRVEVEAAITAVGAEAGGGAELVADGFLSVDGTVIYEMRGFGVSIAAATR